VGSKKRFSMTAIYASVKRVKKTNDFFGKAGKAKVLILILNSKNCQKK
jgi:hypothetical protein